MAMPSVSPEESAQRLKLVENARKDITMLAAKSKRDGAFPTGVEAGRRLSSARSFLDSMGPGFIVTKDLKDKGRLDKILEMVSDSEYHFPADMLETAAALLSRFSNENWGGEAESVSAESSPAVPTSSSVALPIIHTTASTTINLPPADHLIWGQNGIMHGAIRARGKVQQYTNQLNPSLPKKRHDVYGHNGHAPGAWFAMRIVAIFHGAHGASMAGISGDPRLGAYSIVVSDMYEDLDVDRGNTLYYSGSGSHENTDPRQAADSTHGTLQLKASVRTRNPIRVLRAGKTGKSTCGKSWKPSCGLRYDGLYRAVEILTPKNRKGGLYEQFRLERMEGQTPLEDIRRNSPTPEQKAHYSSIKLGY